MLSKNRPNARRPGAVQTVPLHPLGAALRRIAAALERLAPEATSSADLSTADAFVWQSENGALNPVADVNRVPLRLLKGIESQADQLVSNTRNHADGFPANNTLLWGARGCGKSSLVNAVHEDINVGRKGRKRLALVEIHREDIQNLPHPLARLRRADWQCILFCDDLSFEGGDHSYKALKTVLEGGIEGQPPNVVFYATSNRRHMMAREMIENERAVRFIRVRPSRKRCRCRIASACGSVSTT